VNGGHRESDRGKDSATGLMSHQKYHQDTCLRAVKMVSRRIKYIFNEKGKITCPSVPAM
jgi:hypothetical protein